MAELRTGGGRAGGEPPFDPPRGDEGLDDWFARRLEAQGIDPGRRGIPVARILALAALVATLGAFGWILNGATSSSTSTTTPPATHPKASTGGSTSTSTSTGGNTTKRTQKPLWKKIPLTILNGFDPAQAAAGTAKAQLARAGWKVVGVADAGTSTTQTIVVYVPGKLAWAKVVAKRLGLPAPVPIAQAPGVISTQTDNVAIVLGPNLLPHGAGGG
jgi:LytR cell envelope-related transcriptional attenuator